MKDFPRLIEHAFPLQQASLSSVHEKAVRHGHISTLHIWPARRPLAASRAALLATLLPDPGTPEKRRALCEKIGGRIVDEVDKEGRIKETTQGGILRWKQETENKVLLDEFREAILKAYGGRAPRVLDPFAGGGAIPLEAMRLGCEVTASDLNPVAWFLLKCTLEYPQKLAGKTKPLPDFILRDRDFMEAFLKKAHGLKGKKLRTTLEALGHTDKGLHQDEWDFDGAAAEAGIPLEADLAWHIRAWGRRVLAETRKELGELYPTYAEWMPLVTGRAFEPQPMRLLETDAEGIAETGPLNALFSEDYLRDPMNPRWVAKPVVAYLWARTVTCKNCRATLPLLKTRWLCKKTNKRIRLVMKPAADERGVAFSVETNVPERGGNAAQKRENDKKLGAGTMSRSGAQCPCCGTIMRTEDIRYEGRNGRLGEVMTAVVVEGLKSKEYRLPTIHELKVAEVSEESLRALFEKVPFGLPDEPTPKCGPGASRAFSVDRYGFDRWRTLFTNRQLSGLSAILRKSREVRDLIEDPPWSEAIVASLSLCLGKLCDYSATLCTWHMTGEKMRNVIMRYALPITWDYAEVNILSGSSGGFQGCLEWVSMCADHTTQALAAGLPPRILQKSATNPEGCNQVDVIVTDPPYYDAIPYSDLMDFFYVWLRRTLHGLSPEIDAAFAPPLSPKWNHEAGDGELIDDAARHGGDKAASKQAYEDGMARAFQACHASLVENGRLVIVFAHKHPDAWETLVSAIIRAGFVVDGSWPIATEMTNRTRALSSAALASSVWLVCRKRDPLAKLGWDGRVLTEMRANIAAQLREYWDAGIRGPDFVWAATGPAMEAYSKYPAVRKANSPTGELLSVNEFLEAVRRLVVEFVVGRVLHVDSTGNGEGATDPLDPVTSYYLLHRNDFGLGKAPAGACILYAVSCGLSDADLDRTWNLIKVKGSPTRGRESRLESDGEADGNDGLEASGESLSGGEFVLRGWKERREKRMGFEAPSGREVPMIDRIHRLMILWREGDVHKVNEYLDDNALRRNDLFSQVIQSLIELADRGEEERSLLESLSNHLGGKAGLGDRTRTFPLKDGE